MAFVITPDSYVFNNINESSTFIITTDNENYKFEFVNTTSPGNGRVKLDRETNTITSLQYGKGRYKFIDGDESYIFNFEVKRPNADNVQNTVEYVELGQTITPTFNVPDGYSVLRYEAEDLDGNVVTIDSTGYRQTILGNRLGEAVVNVVLSKITTETATDPDDPDADTDVDLESGVEYFGGTITFKVIQLTMIPTETTKSLLLNEEYEVTALYITIDENGTRDTLDIEATFDSTQHCFTLDTRHIIINNGNGYALLITGKSDGEGQIEIKYNGLVLKTLSIVVQDIKGLTINPDVSELKLDYKESFVIDNITFIDNGVKGEVTVDTSDQPPFTYKFEETTANSKIYKLTITNNAKDGGIGKIRIKGSDDTQHQRVIDVKSYKEVIPGELVYVPLNKRINVILARSYDFTYLYYTNAEEIEITIAKPDVLEYRLGELKNIPLVPSEDPDIPPEPMKFPDGSVLHSLYFLGKAVGKTTVTIKTYINDKRNVINEVTFDVSVLANDDLPDNIQLINLTSKPMPYGRKKDILIELPEESATLVLKEELQEDSVLEQGEGFNSLLDTKPKADTNAKVYTDGLNKTYLFINNKEKDKGAEIFVSLDDTENNNQWKNYKTKEVINSKIVYPNPGEKGFGVGPCTQALSESVGLKPYDGCWDSNSDNYGNYYDYLGNTYVFIPKHYIIPKSDSNLAGKYPYFGVSYEFSWEPSDIFTDNTIPRCFINNGKIQEGIFVAKYNGGATSELEKKNSRYDDIDNEKYVSPREGSTSKPSILRITGYSDSVGPTGDRYYSETVAFPELQELAITHREDNNIVDDNGITLPTVKQLHNMTIFIQTMLANLGDVHTIAAYEKGANENVCGKIKNWIAGTLTRRLKNFVSNNQTSEVQMYEQMENYPLGESYFLVRKMYHGSNTGDINPEYKTLFSHNGQLCGVYDINGGINVPLLGVLVVQDPMYPNNYTIYSLKENVDIAELDKTSGVTIEGVNNEAIIFRTPLFDLTNYDKVMEIVDNDQINGVKFLNISNPYTTHNGNTSVLINGDAIDKLSINTGINFNSIKNGGEGNYSKTYNKTYDYKVCNDKHRNSVFYISSLADCTSVNSFKRDQFISMFTANYVETHQESLDGNFDQINFPSGQNDFTGYRTRVLKLLGRLKYEYLGGSKYLFSRRQCITPR